MNARLAWLAGLWDGEGSVGVCLSRSTGTVVQIPQAQINMTHRPTLERALEVFAEIGCSARLQTIVPRDPARHQISYYFAVRRTAWLHAASAALLPYAVTKHEHWRLMFDLCAERISRRGLESPAGSLVRGGISASFAPYTAREIELVTLLRALNAGANNRSATRMEASA